MADSTRTPLDSSIRLAEYLNSQRHKPGIDAGTTATEDLLASRYDGCVSVLSAGRRQTVSRRRMPMYRQDQDALSDTTEYLVNANPSPFVQLHHTAYLPSEGFQSVPRSWEQPLQSYRRADQLPSNSFNNLHQRPSWDRDVPDVVRSQPQWPGSTHAQPMQRDRLSSSQIQTEPVPSLDESLSRLHGLIGQLHSTLRPR
eukprot:TRINITY_DN5368_c0_g1_i1.p1 TRINITY_DN5368_c0_g1~~TRINITY_DN5368_c0_g1_i1.p1  ORF type:complete len:199 (+),score=18.55 TRINITY_DN5368_c0_g1_i1:201-797(+)